MADGADDRLRVRVPRELHPVDHMPVVALPLGPAQAERREARRHVGLGVPPRQRKDDRRDVHVHALVVRKQVQARPLVIIVIVVVVVKAAQADQRRGRVQALGVLAHERARQLDAARRRGRQAVHEPRVRKRQARGLAHQRRVPVEVAERGDVGDAHREQAATTHHAAVGLEAPPHVERRGLGRAEARLEAVHVALPPDRHGHVQDRLRHEPVELDVRLGRYAPAAHPIGQHGRALHQAHAGGVVGGLEARDGQRLRLVARERARLAARGVPAPHDEKVAGKVLLRQGLHERQAHGLAAEAQVREEHAALIGGAPREEAAGRDCGCFGWCCGAVFLGLDRGG